MRWAWSQSIFFQIILIWVAYYLFAPTHCIGESTNTSNTVIVGAVLPLSGDYAQYGEELRRGILLAESELVHDSIMIKVLVEDGGTMIARSSLNAATKLIHMDGAKVILVLGADDVGPLLGLAKTSNVPILSLWDSSKSLYDMGNLVFSNGFSVEKTGPNIAGLFSKNLGLSRIAVIGNSTTWSASITETFKNEITKLGGKIVFSEAVSDDWTDFRTILLRLKKTEAQAIFLPLSLPSGVISCIRQLRELGVEIPIATGEPLVGDAMKQLGPAAEGIYVGWPPAGEDAKLQQAYITRFGKPPWNPSIFKVGYDGLVSIVSAVKKFPDKNLQQALSEYYGASRSANRGYSIFQVKNGELGLLN